MLPGCDFKGKRRQLVLPAPPAAATICVDQILGFAVHGKPPDEHGRIIWILSDFVTHLGHEFIRCVDSIVQPLPAIDEGNGVIAGVVSLDINVIVAILAAGIAKGSIFQHFGSKNGLFFEVYKRAVRSFSKYLDVPSEIRGAGFFDVLRYWLVRTEHMVHEDWIPYRIYLLGNYGTDLVLRHQINRFLMSEDPYGTVSFVRFGLERRELRNDIDLEMMVSILDWTIERFQDALLTAELDPGLFRRQGELAEKKEARIQQFLALLQSAIGTQQAPPLRGRTRQNRRRK